ncbi:hypothetical protein JB92DRAFT_3149286, partial [Gautieria morchelliformis]
MSSSGTGSIIESQILHTTTTRTLHAHNFNKSSTQATHTLTDALSRYLALLAETCAQYAQHAGRTGVTVHDALAALEDIGIGIDELREYVEGEAKDMIRYTGQTARRADELAEIKAAVSEGLKQDHSDAMQLVYAPIPDGDVAWASEDEDEGQALADLDMVLEATPMSIHEKDMSVSFDAARSSEPHADLSSPHLPPSPISPPHARKRARTSNWKPPEHIPDFLPPFPGHVVSPPPSPLHETVTLHGEPTQSNEEATAPHLAARVSISPASITLTPLKPDPKSELDSQPVNRPSSPPLPASSTTSSSYFTSVPYEHSSLASAPEWHLPKPLPHLSSLPVSSTLPALLSSHSYLQSSSLSAPTLQPPNPLRHSLAMMLLGLSSRAYSPAATLFASSNTNTCAPVPHRAVPLPAHAIPLDKNGKANFNISPQKGILPVPPPEWHARSVAGPVALVNSTTVQGSRIPTLARTMLSPPVIARTTRLIPPPPLLRNDQKLLYGPPVPAPWNTTSGVGEGKGVKGAKDNEEDEDEEDRGEPTNGKEREQDGFWRGEWHSVANEKKEERWCGTLQEGERSGTGFGTDKDREVTIVEDGFLRQIFLPTSATSSLTFNRTSPYLLGVVRVLAVIDLAGLTRR